jgi:hypothetical protein
MALSRRSDGVCSERCPGFASSGVVIDEKCAFRTVRRL